MFKIWSLFYMCKLYFYIWNLIIVLDDFKILNYFIYSGIWIKYILFNFRFGNIFGYKLNLFERILVLCLGIYDIIIFIFLFWIRN